MSSTALAKAADMGPSSRSARALSAAASVRTRAEGLKQSSSGMGAIGF